MKSMELHFGVIRDKQAIHAALQQSKSHNLHLAVCFNREGKLIVKICTVINIIDDKKGTSVILRTQTAGRDSDFTLLLASIQSIYPIRDFGMEGADVSQVDWPDDPQPDL